MCGPRACCVNSLSRDGDNGTSDLFNRWREACSFLFAVAKGGQRNTKEKIATAIELAFLFAVARWGQRNLTFVEMQPDYTFLFTVARWGQRNPGSGTVKAWPDQGFYSLSRDGDSGTPGQPGLVGSEGGFYSLSHRKGVHL